MKVVAIAFAILLAGVSALPSKKTNEIEAAIRSGDQRIVTGSIVSAIEDIAQSIADAGLDPLVIERQVLEYALPVPSIFNIQTYVTGLFFRGASNIVVNRMNYAVLTSRLTFNIELPQISLNLIGSEVNVNYFGKNVNSRLSGSIDINSIVLTGDIRVSIGVLTGISIRSMELGFSLDGIDSNLNYILQDVNLSPQVNEYLGRTIPTTLKAYESDINDLLTIVARDIVDANL